MHALRFLTRTLRATCGVRQDEEKVNWMVQQWLQERGYVRALKALQEVTAYVFVKIVYYACRQ